MKKIFWTVITSILFLSVLSLILYSGEEEVITEPVPEHIADMLTDLRETVDDMAGKYAKMVETKNLAIAARNTTWLSEAERIQENIAMLYNSRVRTLVQRLNAEQLGESPAKQMSEFLARADNLVAVDSRRDMLIARKNLGVRIDSDAWISIANMYKAMENAYDRNVGLLALGFIVGETNTRLADSILRMIDDPYFNVRKDIEMNRADSENLTNGIADPYLGFNVMLTAGAKSLTTREIDNIKLQIGKFSDDNEKAFLAARALTVLTRMQEQSREQFYAEIEKADDHYVLLAETKLKLVQKGAVTGSAKEQYLNSVDELVPQIAQNFPRERIISKMIMLNIENKPVEEIIHETEKLKSLTLREEVLTFAALNKPGLSDDDVKAFIDAMHEPYSKFAVKISQFYSIGLTGDEAKQFLEPLAGYTDEISENGPKIELLSAWATVDPFRVRNDINSFGTAVKVDAAAKVTGVITSGESSLQILNDVHIEVSTSTAFEPLEKAELLRKIGSAMLPVNRVRGLMILEEAHSTLGAM